MTRTPRYWSPANTASANARRSTNTGSKSRGGKGIITIKTTDKVGNVVGALSATDADEVMLTTAQGQTVRCPCKDIRVAGRNTQGVKLINLNKGDKLVAIARVISEQQEQQAEAAE